MYFLFIILLSNIFEVEALAEDSDCIKRYEKNVSDSCDNDETILRGGSPYHACDLVMGHINCHIQRMTEKCGENGTRLYMRTEYKPVIESSACVACEKGYRRMEEFGGHLYREDPGVKPFSTFCNRHDYINVECKKNSDRKELLADLSKCEQHFANEINQMIKIDNLQKKKVAYCSALDYVARCIYFDVWTHCDGKETNETDVKIAKEYMQKIGWTVPHYSFCAICERTNNFLKRIIGKELYAEDKTWVPESVPTFLPDTNVLRGLNSRVNSPPIDQLPPGISLPCIFPHRLCPDKPGLPNQADQTNGYWSIRPVYCQTFEPEPPVLTTPALPDSTSTLTPQSTELSSEVTEISASTTSETTEVSTTPTVPPPCVQWRNVSADIRACSTVQQTFMDPQQTCNYKLVTATCVWNKIRQTCPEEDAIEFMKTYFLTVEYHVCPYCMEVSEYLEKNGGRLYQLGGPTAICTHKEHVPTPEPVCPDMSIIPRCFLNFQLISFIGGEIDHQATCRYILEFMECEYNEVRISCGNETAIEYMKNRVFSVLDKKYCEVPHCKEITRYLETQFDNHLYYGANNEEYCNWTAPDLNATTCIDQKAVDSCSLSTGTDPDCKNKFLEVKCKFDSVKTTCDQDMAIKHMNQTTVSVESTECEVCILAVQFLEGYGSYLKIGGTDAGQCELKGNKSAEVTERPPIDLSCTESAVLTTDMAECAKEYRINNSRDPKEICDKQLEIAKCVYEAVKISCNETIAAAFMRTPLFYIFNGICTECIEYAKFLEKFGGNLFAIGGHVRTCNAKPSPSISSTPEPTESFPCEQREQIPRRCKQLGIVAHDKEHTCEYIYQMAMCIFDEVKRHCNQTTAMEYLKIASFEIPDPSYCDACRKAVKYLYYMGNRLYYGRNKEGECQSPFTTLPPTISTTTEISNGSTDSTTTALSTTTAEPQKCEDILAMKQTIMFCLWDVETPEDPEKEICDRVTDAAKCLYEGALNAGCDNKTAMAYMGSATLTVEYKNCQKCTEAIHFLESLGGHLYAYGAIGDNTTMCTETPVGPPPEPLCPEIDTTSPGACAQVRIASDETSEACDSLYIMLECMTTETKTKCNETVAHNYMARAIFGIPSASYCPACENVIRYLKAMGNHLYDYSTPNGKCDDSFITVPTFTTVPESSSNVPLTSTTSPTETTTTDTTLPTTHLWYPAFPCITVKAGIGINLCVSSRDHGTNDIQYSKTACNATVNLITCVNKTIAAVCDENDTRAFMKKTKMFAVDPEWCPYCNEAIELAAKIEAHVYEWDHNGVPTNRTCQPTDCSSSALKSRIEKKCVIKKKTTPEDVCSELHRVAECAHLQVEEQCDLSRADSFMKTDFSPTVNDSQCPHCAEVVGYMGRFGGHVYLEDGKTVCDAKENAALTIYHTVPFFYVLLIFFTFFA